MRLGHDIASDRVRPLELFKEFEALALPETGLSRQQTRPDYLGLAGPRVERLLLEVREDLEKREFTVRHVDRGVLGDSFPVAAGGLPVVVV